MVGVLGISFLRKSAIHFILTFGRENVLVYGI
mgnify:CR=1 FL=1